MLFWARIAVNHYQIEPGYIPVYVYIYVYILCNIYIYIYIYIFKKHSSQSNLNTQYIFYLYLDLNYLATVYTVYPYYFLGTMVTLMN